MFPQGLPDEYAFVTTFKFRKTSRREDWYLWQVFDKYGIPQVGQPNVNSIKFDFFVSKFRPLQGKLRDPSIQILFKLLGIKH